MLHAARCHVETAEQSRKLLGCFCFQFVEVHNLISTYIQVVLHFLLLVLQPICCIQNILRPSGLAFPVLVPGIALSAEMDRPLFPIGWFPLAESHRPKTLRLKSLQGLHPLLVWRLSSSFFRLFRGRRTWTTA